MEQSASQAQLCNGGVCVMDRIKPGALNTLKHQLTEISTQSSDRTSCTVQTDWPLTVQHWPVMAVKGALSKILET